MIVVTGASGFIGSNLVNHLRSIGKHVIAVDYIRRDYIDPKIEFVYDYDLMDIIHLYDNIECVFHEGAISSTTETDWSKLFKQNVKYTAQLMEYCNNNKIPLQYASSASVYGNPTVEEWHSKTKILDPLNLYAKSKFMIDMCYCNLTPTNTLMQGMRYFNVYGPNEDHKGDQASPYHKFRKQFEETGRIKLFEGSKEFLRDFIHVDEIIEKKLYCLENKSSGIYDVGTGKPKSFYDVALEIGGSDDVIDWIPMPDNLKEHYQKYTCANMNWL
jgi:ADP-L-glycero-D-manno-heptose 6-epimerase